jgi:hypothetical protein
MSAVYDSTLLAAVHVTITADGTLQYPFRDQSIPTENDNDNNNNDNNCDLYINCRQIENQEGVDKLCALCQEQSFAARIKVFDFSGAKLTDLLVSTVLLEAVRPCVNLVELNLSYLPLGYKAVLALCNMIDVKISGNNNKRLCRYRSI